MLTLLKVLIPTFLIILLIYLILTFLPNFSNNSSTPQLNSNPISQTIQTLKPTPKPLTLESIFDQNFPIIDDQKITLLATGDIIPARSVNFQTVSRNNFIWPYLNISPILKDTDLTFIDLETPLITNCPITQEGMKFCGDQRNIEGLILSGVDVASLANNHSTNYGPEGINQTIDLLTQNNITPTGIKGPIYKTVKGIKFAFLAYNDISPNPSYISNADEQKITQEVKEAKQNADIVIVQYHWGTEYQSQPDQRQVDLGHLTIDAGADLVIGNHPHWIKPIEIYKDKLITYAHGNTVFDQMWSEQTKQGVLGKYIFDGKNLIDVEYIPIYIKDYGQPEILMGDKKQKILDYMYQESLKLKNNL